MSPAQPGGAARHRGDAAGLAAGQDAAEVATGTRGRGAGRNGAARGHASREWGGGGGKWGRTCTRGKAVTRRTDAPVTTAGSLMTWSGWTGEVACATGRCGATAR